MVPGACDRQPGGPLRATNRPHTAERANRPAGCGSVTGEDGLVTNYLLVYSGGAMPETEEEGAA